MLIMKNVPDCQYDFGYEEPKAIVLGVCDDCDSDINEGDEYYEIEGYTICTDCIEEHKYRAEIK